MLILLDQRVEQVRITAAEATVIGASSVSIASSELKAVATIKHQRDIRCSGRKKLTSPRTASHPGVIVVTNGELIRDTDGQRL